MCIRDRLEVALMSLKAVIPGYFDEHPDEKRPYFENETEEESDSCLKN